jgi:hypothetical protein
MAFSSTYIKTVTNVQLVSLAQEGNEISQDTIENAGTTYSK